MAAQVDVRTTRAISSPGVLTEVQRQDTWKNGTHGLLANVESSAFLKPDETS